MKYIINIKAILECPIIWNVKFIDGTIVFNHYKKIIDQNIYITNTQLLINKLN